MALYVDTTKCAADAQIRHDSAIQYNLGLIMMVLGIPELTDETLPEFHARLEVYLRLSGFIQPDEGEAYWTAAQASVGVRINGKDEKRAAWLKRISTSHFNAIMYEQAHRKSEAKAAEAQLPLGV